MKMKSMATVSFGAVALMVAGMAPAAAQSNDDKPVFTYVAEYRMKAGKGQDFWAYFEKTAQPILDQMVADGSLLEWGRTAMVVHTADGMTDSMWWCARSEGTLFKVIEKLAAAPRPANATDAVEKHADKVLQSLVFKTGGKAASAAYLETSTHIVKPGKGREWFEAFKRFQQPVYEKLLAEGTILGYGIDRELIHTAPGGLRGVWVLLPSAEAMDKEGDAFDAAFAGRSPEEGRMMQAAMAELVDSSKHRDGVERVIRYVRK
jgi:hypothetical protein